MATGLPAEGVDKRCVGRTPVETSQPKSIEFAKEDKRIEHPRVGKRSTASGRHPGACGVFGFGAEHEE